MSKKQVEEKHECNCEDIKLEKEVLVNQLKKVLADYQNLERDLDKRLDIRTFQSKKSIVDNFIPILDATDLALNSSEDIKWEGDEKAWVDGVREILRTIFKVLESIGLRMYYPNKGDDFDSELHEAVAMYPDEKKGKIFDITQPGYILEETVIRPARVVVGSKEDN